MTTAADDVRYVLYEQGRTAARQMCNRNMLPVPVVKQDDKLGLTGLYDGDIRINLAKTALPASSPRVWSWPGYKVDRTAYGVVLHELGHHFDVKLGRLSKQATWRAICLREPPMTGYEPTNAESFAEAFRLFCTNPRLLMDARPERFEFLLEDCEILPIEHRPWLVVLKDAPERVKNAAVRWAA